MHEMHEHQLGVADPRLDAMSLSNDIHFAIDNLEPETSLQVSFASGTLCPQAEARQDTLDKHSKRALPAALIRSSRTWSKLQ